MNESDNRTQIYAKTRDRERLKKLADRNIRQPVDQLTVVIDEFCKAHRLDPETVAVIDADSA